MFVSEEERKSEEWRWHSICAQSSLSFSPDVVAINDDLTRGEEGGERGDVGRMRQK